MAKWYNKLIDAVTNTDDKNESVNENRKYAIVDGVYMKNNEIRKTALRHMRTAYHMLPEYLTYGLGKLQGLVEETILPNKNEKDIFTYTHDNKTIFSQNINRKYLSFLSDKDIIKLQPENITSLSKGSYTAWGGKYEDKDKGENIYPYEDLSGDTEKDIKSKLYEFTKEEIGNEKWESNPFRYIRENNEKKWFNKDKPYAVEKDGKTLKTPYQNYEIFDEGDTSGSTNYAMDKGGNNYIDPTKDHSTTPNLKYKTIKLFNEHKIDTMVSRFSLGNNKGPEFIDSTISENYGNSHGRSLLAKKPEEKVEGYNRPFCRTWTNKYQYDNVNKLIRGVSGETYGYWNSGHGSNTTQLSNKSVLSNNGFVRITPSSTDKTDLTKCMFSIENLAWKDVLLDKCLTSEQRGPNGGRIMWFPPYDLSFQETANVTWNENRFIGRGESIYTYTNTMRSGTLGFTLLIDHPSILNKAVMGRNDTEALEMDILRFFAGEGELDIKIDSNSNEQNKNGSGQPQGEQVSIRNNDSDLIHFRIYFPYKYSGNVKLGNGNIIDEYDKDVFDYLTECYEVSNKKNIEKDKQQKGTCIRTDNSHYYEYRTDADLRVCFKDTSNYKYTTSDNLNDEFKNLYTAFKNTDDEIYDDLFGSNNVSVTITYDSGEDEYKGINMLRAIVVKKYIEDTFRSRGNNKVKINVEIDEDGNETFPLYYKKYDSDVNSKENKEKRYVKVTIKYDKPEIINLFANKERIETNNRRKFNGNNVATANITNSGSADNKYYSEFDYFADIAKKQDFAYESIKDKVTYFNPAYHSLTPEGFNERLNFLHQCTRQGHTIENTNKENNNKFKTAGNLAFGRPPICVLRIGDFINTKIIIDSLTIQYDNRGIQWDLNHDGIGVQPMYAKVNMGIKIIGGQSLEGPVANLNNAVSFNYYANTGVYDKRAQVEKSNDKYISTWSVTPKKRKPNNIEN